MWQFPEPDYWPRTYVEVGCMAFAIAAFTMPLAIAAMQRFNFVDAVDPSKLHRNPVPRGGGIIIWLAFACAVVFPGYRSDSMNGILVGSFICMLVGAVDDFVVRIPGSYKLLTLFAVTLVLSYFGVRTSLFQHPVPDTLLTMLWIAGVTSAFNGADNMDGAGAGIAIIVALLFFFIAVQSYMVAGTETSLAWFGMLAIGLAGACAGFLLYNFNPAAVFMGDSGSFFLGFMLAALSVMGEWTESPVTSAIIPVLILGVPLFDFAYVILVRIARGETRTLRDVIDHCAPDHLSHRLMWLGFGQRKAVAFIYLFCFALGVTGVLVRNTPGTLDTVLAILQGVAILAIIIGLMLGVEWRHRTWVRDEIARVNQESSRKENQS